MVDAVNEVIDIPMAEIEPALGFGAGINAHLIKGVGKVNGKGVIIFSLDHVLLDDQMLSLGSMSEARFRESEILA